MEFILNLNFASPQPNKNLTDESRRDIYNFLMQHSTEGRLKKGAIEAVASSIGVSRRTISRIWNRGKVQQKNGESIDVSSRKHGRVGRKRIEIDLSRIAGIPLRSRTNIRSLSKAMGISTKKLHQLIKEGKIRPHSSAMKPYLTEANKKSRLEFCLSMLDPHSLPNNPVFCDMFDCVHIDEKLFFMSRITQKCYLLPSEVDPLRTSKSKRFIEKIMFIAATARPRFDSSGDVTFSGKIGIFPFVIKEAAKRNSKDKIAGTMETKSLLSITKDVTRAYLIEKILPAIREKWPRCCSKTIFIQQDNAKPHIDPADVEFREAACKDGFDIRLTFQPPNSPDLNVLNLGFFRAIQSLQHEKTPRTIDELIAAVEKSYDELSPECLNRVFVSLQLCMVQIMNCLGSNNYKIPHVGKRRLEEDGVLPLQVNCGVDFYEKVKQHLNQE